MSHFNFFLNLTTLKRFFSEPKATQDEIRSAYKRGILSIDEWCKTAKSMKKSWQFARGVIRETHPDVNPSTDAADRSRLKCVIW